MKALWFLLIVPFVAMVVSSFLGYNVFMELGADPFWTSMGTLVLMAAFLLFGGSIWNWLKKVLGIKNPYPDGQKGGKA